MTKLFDHLVLDSAPLLNGTLPESLSKNFYTIPEVIEEIRDEGSRARLNQLPFKLVTRSPSAESLAMVSRFARATGDLSVLSATDLKVVALTVTLELENNRELSRLRRDPNELPKQQTHAGAKEYFESLKTNSKKNRNASEKSSKDLKKKNRKGGIEVDFFDEVCAEIPAKAKDSKVEEDENDSSDGEWITPDNLDSFKSANSSTGKSEWNAEGVKEDSSPVPLPSLSKTLTSTLSTPTTPSITPIISTTTMTSSFTDIISTASPITPNTSSATMASSITSTISIPTTTSSSSSSSISRVACITSDFAMQNVLLQMCLELYTPDGCRVKSVKNWLLRCHACFETTRDMEARFCPKCGGPTLMRTSFMIDERGACHLFLRSDFQYNVRGTKYAAPKFKGGRQGASLILREDQKEFQRQKEHYHRIQSKIQKNQDDEGTLEAIDDRIAAVFGGGNVGQGNRRYDAYDGMALPTVGFGRKNPNSIIKKNK
jgi:RNA-binding protein NOB1